MWGGGGYTALVHDTPPPPREELCNLAHSQGFWKGPYVLESPVGTVWSRHAGPGVVPSGTYTTGASCSGLFWFPQGN